MKITYQHYRITEIYRGVVGKRGKPLHSHLSPFNHSKGLFSAYIMPSKPLPRGGLTVCTIRDDNGIILSADIALCSMSDNFCYKTGRQISYERAMSKLPREDNDGGS